MYQLEYRMIEIKENKITIKEYLEIRAKVGWVALMPEQAEKALRNSLYVVGAYEDDCLVAMGRVVGDGAVICYIQDLIVVPEGQRKGLGSMVLKELISYVEMLTSRGTQMMLCLMCAKGREAFYEQHGFIARPNDRLGPGMIKYLKNC